MVGSDTTLTMDSSEDPSVCVSRLRSQKATLPQVVGQAEAKPPSEEDENEEPTDEDIQLRKREIINIRRVAVKSHRPLATHAIKKGK